MAARLPRAAADASDPKVLEATRELLAVGHAVDAVVAGVLAACALSPSVLLGPVQLLVGGAGAGLHAVDGRVQQAGKGLARPRGFVAGDSIPDAARVGAPVLPAAVSAALAAFGKLALARVLGPAIELSRRASPLRREVLRRMSERGPLALSDARVAGELVLAAGRGQGGLLHEEDLAALRPAVVDAEWTSRLERRVATVPWGAEAVRTAATSASSPAPPTSETRIVAAVDRRGQFCVACYEVATAGLVIEALDLVAPLVAAPVLRGKTRVPPGLAHAAGAPIALLEEEGALILAAGIGEALNAEATLGAWLPSSVEVAVDRDVPGLVALQRVGGIGVRAL